MAHFDFPYTCPRIDKAINRAEATISSHLENVLNEVCPLLDHESVRNYVSASAAALYKDLEECFEAVRDTNVDMRSEAESQLKDMHEEFSSTIHVLQEEIDNLKEEVNA